MDAELLQFTLYSPFIVLFVANFLAEVMQFLILFAEYRRIERDLYRHYEKRWYRRKYL